MTGESVAWVVSFVTHVTKQMLYEAQFHIADGKSDALVKRFLDHLLNDRPMKCLGWRTPCEVFMARFSYYLKAA